MALGDAPHLWSSGCAAPSPVGGRGTSSSFHRSKLRIPSLSPLTSRLGLALPGVLLVHAALPFWATLLGSARAQAAQRGVRAAAAGLLIAAALLFLEAVRSPPERAIVLLVLAALNIDPARLPSRLGERFVPPLAILAGAVLGVPLCLQFTIEAA